MSDIIKKFTECWKEFEKEYKNSKIISLEDGDGTPSESIWGEYDVQYHLAKICEKNFPDKKIHLEVNGIVERNRIDLIICDDKQSKEIVKNSQGSIDLVVEIAILINKGGGDKTGYWGKEPSYNIKKVEKNAKTLNSIIQEGIAKDAVLCIINKVSFAKEDNYKKIIDEFPKVKILKVHDNEIS